MADSFNPQDQFGSVEFPSPMQPMGPRPNIPSIRDQPAQPPDTGGLINLFKSWFHRQDDLDNIMKQMQPGIPGVNGAMPPATDPSTGLRRSAIPSVQPEIVGVRG